MKLNPTADLIAFLEEVKQCQGDVYFETSEGDKLNLKSILSQYLFAVLAGKKALLEKGVLKCENEADGALLKKHLI